LIEILHVVRRVVTLPGRAYIRTSPCILPFCSYGVGSENEAWSKRAIYSRPSTAFTKLCSVKKSRN